MTLSRRRFLTITAAALATPVIAAPLRWQGGALGADCTLEIHAPRDVAERALRDTRALLRRAESLFSLYDPASELSQLNATGHLPDPSPEMCRIIEICDQVHDATGGAFDPSVQPLWQALAKGTDVETARALVGWTRAKQAPLRLDHGQNITLNGVAQGFATDMVTTALHHAGLGKALINIGEHAAIGGPFTLGIADPAQGIIAQQTLHNNAVATSSPNATVVGSSPHILSATGRKPRWDTVSVMADTAAMADAASTAFCLMTKPEIKTAMSTLNLHRAALLAPDGKVHHL